MRSPRRHKCVSRPFHSNHKQTFIAAQWMQRGRGAHRDKDEGRAVAIGSPRVFDNASKRRDQVVKMQMDGARERQAKQRKRYRQRGASHKGSCTHHVPFLRTNLPMQTVRASTEKLVRPLVERKRAAAIGRQPSQELSQFAFRAARADQSKASSTISPPARLLRAPQSHHS